MVGFGLTLPALPFFVERMALGATASSSQVALHVGMLTSAYALSQVVLGPIMGGWSDERGRRPLLLVGLVGFAVSQAAFGLGTSLSLLYPARIVAGGSAAALLTASSAVVADVLREEDRARGLAWIGTASSLGVVVGPAMSGFLSRGTMHGHAMIGGLMLDGFSIPFLAAGALAMTAVLPITLFLPETRSREAQPGTEHHPPVSLTDLLLLTLAAQFALSSFEAIFALYGSFVLDLTAREIGWGFVVCGAVMALQGVIVGLLDRRLSRTTQVAIGFLALGVGIASLTLTRTLAAALATIGVLAFGMSLITPNLTAAVAERRPGALGSALALQATAGGIGRVLGPVTASLLFSLRPRLPLLLTGAVAVMVAIAITRSRSTEPREFGG